MPGSSFGDPIDFGHLGTVSSSTHYFLSSAVVNQPLGAGGSLYFRFVNDVDDSSIMGRLFTFHLNFGNVHLFNSGFSEIDPSSTINAGTYYFRIDNPGSIESVDFGISVGGSVNIVDTAGDTEATALLMDATPNKSGELSYRFGRDYPANGGLPVVTSTIVINDRVDFWKFHLDTESMVTLDPSGTYGGFVLKSPAQGNIGSESWQLVPSNGQTYDLIAGDYYIEVFDSATSVTVGASVIAITFPWEVHDLYSFTYNVVAVPPKPDLIIDTLSVGSTSLAAGGSTTVSYHLHNVGAATAAPSVARIYLSTDALITTSDTVLFTTTFTNSVDANFFISDSQTVTLPGTLTAGTYYIGVIADYNDQIIESNNLNNASNAITITVSSAGVAGSVSINDVTTTEGNAGSHTATFTVTRTGGTAAFSVNYATANNTAASGSDYVATAGTLSFGSGVNTQTFTVTINGDTTFESNETFFVNLSGATNGATISDSQGIGTISNDDLAGGDDFAGDSSTAGNIAASGSVTGNIETAGDHDWFRIQMSAGVTYTIDLRGSPTGAGTLSDTLLRLYDGSSVLITSNDDFGGTLNSHLVYAPTASGTYFFDAEAFGSNTGTYTLSVTGSGAAVSTAPRDFNGDGNTDLLLHNGQQLAEWLMNGTAIQAGSGGIGGLNAGWSVNRTGDFNGDGHTDLLLQNGQQLAEWLMNGTALQAGSGSIGGLNAGWSVAGTGDFNGDGKADILLQNGQQLAEWLMNGTSLQAGSGGIGTLGPGWTVAGSGDFNHDGHADLLLQNGQQLAEWLMNGTAIQAGSGGIGTLGPGWTVAGTGDFNADGNADLLLKNGQQLAEWLMNGTAIQAGSGGIGTLGPGWTVANTFASTGDFNHDGHADILLQNGQQLAEWLMNGTALQPGSGGIGALNAGWLVV